MLKVKFFLIILILSALMFIVPSRARATYPAEVPRTGQMKCYDSFGNIIKCTGTGQDGEIQAGAVWPIPRFIDNDDGIIIDKLTGLMWTKDANLMAGQNSWQNALDFVEELNSTSYMGYIDWRLPNYIELASLSDAQNYNPPLQQNNPFTNVQVAYWSSNYGIGMKMDMSDMSTIWQWPTDYFPSVWPVRAGQCGSSDSSAICLPKTGVTTCYDSNGKTINCAGTGQDGELQAGIAVPDLRSRYINNGDGTVTDSVTGLNWTNDAIVAGGLKTWQGALDYVKTLTIGGHSDWRLPNIKEIESMYITRECWSSTTYAYDPSHAWAAKSDFRCLSKARALYVWPVRAGQVGNPVISTTTTTTTTMACPTIKVLGSDNLLLDNLRDFRDSRLAQSAVGRRIINLYYNNSDAINTTLERNHVLQAVVRRALEIIAPMMRRNRASL